MVMAKAVAMLDLLKDKPLSGLFVTEYFLMDKVLNSMEFNSGAVHSNANNMSFTIVKNRVDGINYADAVRAWGEDYVADNSEQVEETFYLKVHGGAYKVDTTLDAVVRNVVTENEAREKMNLAVNAFAYHLIKGNGVGKQMLGIEKYCVDNKLEYKDVFDLEGVITEEKALAFLEIFNDALAELTVEANAIYCSRAMESKLQTIQSVLKRYTETVKIEKLNYKQFLDLPIIPFDNKVGLKHEEGDAIIEDMYILRIDSNNGVFCASPSDKTAFVRVVKPQETSTGKPNAEGFVDFATCLVVKNDGALRRLKVKIGTKVAGLSAKTVDTKATN